MVNVLEKNAVETESVNKILHDRIMSALNETEKLGLSVLKLVDMGLGEIDAAPARIKETGEEVVVLIIKAFDRAIPICHLAKAQGIYEPRLKDEFLD